VRFSLCISLRSRAGALVIGSSCCFLFISKNTPRYCLFRIKQARLETGQRRASLVGCTLQLRQPN
jgi:hypothetical protein